MRYEFESEDQESAYFSNTSESSWIKYAVPTPDICVYMYIHIYTYILGAHPLQMR